MAKKYLRLAVWIMLIFVIGGIGAVVTERYLFPHLLTSDFFSRYKFLRRAAENVTIVNRTEQVIVQEDTSINKIASQAATTVVHIISIPQKTVGDRVAATHPSVSGTGALVTSDGMIVTYRTALVETNARYRVLLFNGQEYDAALLYSDAFTNLAFLRINTSNLPVIAFANSDDARPGKKLIAIGNAAAEYQNRYAAGLLSAVNKTFNIAGGSVLSSEKLEGIFEIDFTDLAEYRGGPVIDFNGEMIGIVGDVQLDGKTKYFLVPANDVREAMDRTIRGALDTRPMLGVSYISITKAYATAQSLSRDRGALIYSPSGRTNLAVITNSPAEKAGLRVGDIIMSVDGTEIDLDHALSKLIARHARGETITLHVFRAGTDITLTVTL
ncbi:MAG TPA: trypsin-like peptidase domain-containing protein [Patescibacteria group bacterium]|nr:trypsin-like peptidase domain-containing protein [Patescibacteria group bacterium]